MQSKCEPTTHRLSFIYFDTGSAVIQAHIMTTSQAHQHKIFLCKACNNLLIGLRCFLHHAAKCSGDHRSTANRAISWLSKDRKSIIGPKPAFILQWIDCVDCALQWNHCLDFGTKLPPHLKWVKLVGTFILAQARKRTLLACSRNFFSLKEVTSLLANFLI